VTGALAVNASHQLDDLLVTRDVSPTALSEERDSMRTLSVTTDVLIGAGVAAAVIGTVFWIFDTAEVRRRALREQPPTRTGASLRLDVGLAGLSLSGRY
jgi:hypothetical protein